VIKVVSQKILWRGLRFLGLSRQSWNQQYQAGIWTRESRSPHIVKLVGKLCGGGKLVEFGCGEGELACLLPVGTFSEYNGIDISDVAVERARRRVSEKGVARCQFSQCDMVTWKGASGVSVILLEECLYYLTPQQIPDFLRRCSLSLTENGRIIVVVHSAEKHAETLDACRSTCRVTEQYIVDLRVYLILSSQLL
jgi:cyclopropane fatty-acyl-phospholipid synthase-like methyltransferase